MKNIKLEKICFLGLFLSLGIYGCSSKFIAGEGLSVLAEIRDTQGKQLNSCAIELQNKDGEILDGPDNVPGKFHKVFTIIPNNVDYLISISCPGFKTHEITATYGEDVTPIRPLRLGKITMESLSLQLQ